jgi:hypothetical protein
VVVAATFRINQAFELKSRGMLMVAGQIVDGVIRVGDRTSDLGPDLVVSAVEMLTRSDRTCDVALGFRYSDEAELELLRRRASAGTTLAIASSEST